MKPTRTEIMQEFMKGRGCSQVVLGQYADKLGYDTEETDRMAACFPGGMFSGETCGAVTGALMAIGLAVEDPEEAKKAAIAFQKDFAAAHGSCICRDLLGYDLSKPEEEQKAVESGKMLNDCPAFVRTALNLLDKIPELEEDA